VDVPNAKYELIPGMYASVKIPLHTVTGALTVPVQAVRSSGGGEGVVLTVDATNHVRRRQVKLGLETATDAEILGGLQENETVIFGEQNQFHDGQLVAPKFIAAPGGE